MDMLDKRLNDKGKNWRHVLKALKVLDYCLHEGSDLVGTWARKNIYIIKTLREFQYTDDDGRDVGQNGMILNVCYMSYLRADVTFPVRISAKELTALIIDEERLRNERRDRKNWKSRVTGIEDYAGGDSMDNPSEGSSRKRPVKKRNTEEDDAEYKLAIEASKYEAEQDKERRARATSTASPDDEDLAKAIRLSEEEAELRRKELEESNSSSLFDEITPQTTQQPQYTGYNQGYQQQGAVDWFGNPVDQQAMQQPQATGYLNNAYTQSLGQTPTGMNGFGTQMQPQPTGYDQYHQQMQQQQPMIAQQTAMQGSTSPFGLGAMAQSQATPTSGGLQPGSNNPWAQQNQSADTLRPLPTGSNNPFAQTTVHQPPPPQPFGQQSLSMMQQQNTAVPSSYPSQPQSPFSPITAHPFGNPPQQPSATPQSFPQPSKEQNPHHARLNALLATGDGMDTYGNTGDLRIPAQHTAPGTFVNSASHGLNKLNMQQTGTNPFLHQQFTGVPQSQQQAGGFGQQSYGSGQSSGFAGGSNPFSQQQRPGPPGHSNSLIEL